MNPGPRIDTCNESEPEMGPNYLYSRDLDGIFDFQLLLSILL